jgi:F-type H+-transporting ATPase subunit b
MPQLNQLSDVILSQLFWLAIVLGFIYFVIGRGMVTRIQSTVDKRDQRITADLMAAEQARSEADETEEAYRLRMDHSRSEAMKLTSAAKQASAKETEKRAAKADAANRAKLEKAEARIRAASDKARADIEKVAAEMTQDIVKKVAGLNVGRDEAAAAVKVAVTHG